MTDRPGVVTAAVAGTEMDDRVLRAAVDAARAHDARLHVAHVVPVVAVGGWFPVQVDPLDSTAQARLDAAVERARELASDLDVRGSLHAGTPAADLVGLTRHSRLMVMGRESRHGGTRLVLGSVTAAVAAHAACPVRVVPPDGPEDGDGPVVVGVAGPSGAPALVDHAAQLAALASGVLVLAHVQPASRGHHRRDAALDEVRAALRDLAANAGADHDVVTRVEVAYGDPAEVLPDLARTASVLVLRRVGLPLLGGHLGRVARHVLTRADAPVEVVPAAPDVGDHDAVAASLGDRTTSSSGSPVTAS